jgi:hypothetical protein
MDESLTDRLINTDLSAMNRSEKLAHLDAVEQHMRDLLRTQLTLLEENPQLVALRPELRARLDRLRGLNFDADSGS